jgi:two-component system LytT family sensor kinase
MSGHLEAVKTSRGTLYFWLATFVVWTSLACLFAAQTGIFFMYRGEDVPWGNLLKFSIADWYSCGVFLPLYVYITRRWPIERAHLATTIPLHAALILSTSAAKIALFRPVKEWLGRPDTVSLSEALGRGMISESIAFIATAAGLHAIVYYQRFKERERFALQLQARLSDAQLRALRAQLNPHFLFNTLNAVAALLHKDADRADAMLTRLGELLRLTLRADPAHEVPLHQEMETLERYLGIMRMRFSDRVTIRSEVDPAATEGLVPSFILQPIVENAFEHGMAPIKRPGEIVIGAARSNDALVLSVRDNGEGVAPGTSDGVGLGNTRQRLSELYGEKGSLDVKPREGGGTLVELRIPFRAALAT